jgi:thiol-disulfide isomerase/thioredoxin
MNAPPRRRFGWILGGVLGVLWCLYLGLNGPAGSRGDLLPPELKAPKKTLTVDYDWNITDLDGRSVPFSRFRGKAVFLNFWATWCAPCVEELPAISRLAQDDRLKDVAFVALALDDDPVQLKKYVADHRIKAPVFLLQQIPPAVFLPADDPSRLATPVTFLIAPDGHIASIHDGPAQWDDPAVVEFLKTLAESRSP